MRKYDLVVIGSGPGGEKAAVKAAYFGHKVAVVEKESIFGGAGINTGTLPSKTLKETALFLSGKFEKGLYGVERALEHEATAKDFLFRKDLVTTSAAEEVAENIRMHGVDVYHGVGCFLDEHQILIKGPKEETIYGEYIIIATGSYPVHPPNIPFDLKRVHDSDSILGIRTFPGSVAVLGAGVIGFEYATIFATMGCKVYLINRSDRILTFLDQEILQHLLEQVEKQGVELTFNAGVTKIDIPSNENDPLNVQLDTEATLHVDMFLFAAGRNGNTKALHLDRVGIPVTNRELIEVDETYRTRIPNIYAVGDCIGFPALASTSMDQGRVAVAHIFKTNDLEYLSPVLPYGIYTVPEISTVGLSEQQAKEKGMRIETGRYYHAKTHRGKIMGAKAGMLKIVFTKDDLVIQGVHIIGHLATEMIHYGVLLVEGKKTVMNVISAVFNHPTLHDLYKYACYDGLSNLTGKKVKI
jgi:NAD(P) transhydrogenase